MKIERTKKRWRKSDLLTKEEIKAFKNNNPVLLLPDYENDVLLSVMWCKNRKVYYHFTSLSQLLVAHMASDIQFNRKLSIYKLCLQNLFYCIPEKYRIPLKDVNFFWCEDKERLNYFQDFLNLSKAKGSPLCSFMHQVSENRKHKAYKIK